MSLGTCCGCRREISEPCFWSVRGAVVHNEDAKLLVCATADAPRKVPGSVFGHVCSDCSVRVMMAPTGQKFLKANPDAKIVCTPCFVARAMSGPVDGIRLAGSADEMAQEIRSACPNDWGQRN